MSEALPDDYAGYALVGQIDGRGSKHVIWVNNHSGSRAAAYPPEGICNSDTWATAEPMYRASDLAAHDREVKAEAWDEGAAAGWDRDGFVPYSLRRKNPYRIEPEGTP